MRYLFDAGQDRRWVPQGPPRPWGRQAAAVDDGGAPGVQAAIDEEQHVYETQTAMVAEADGRPQRTLTPAQRALVDMANGEGAGGDEGVDEAIQAEMIRDAGD